MKKALALLTFMVFGITGIVGAASFTNGSFETGDFSGWSTTNFSGGSSSVVTSNAGYVATDGSYFANLTANSLLSQAQTWVAGETISFDWNFNSNDWYPDFSLFTVLDLNNVALVNITLATTYDTGSYNATGWNTYDYTFANAGSGYIGFGVYNAWDSSLDSQLYIDNVNGGEPVPEPATLLLLGTGLAGLAFYRRKRK